MILENHRRLPVCIFSDKIATIKSFLVSNFKGASYNFEFDYFINKETNNGKNHQRMYRKYLFNDISPKKLFIS